MATPPAPTPPTSSFQSRILTKVGVSVLFGLLGFVIGQLMGADLADNVMLGMGLSVFISGVAFITQFLIEVDHRVARVGTGLANIDRSFAEHVASTKLMIKDEFAKVNEATQLFGAVEASALNTDAMTQLVKNATTIGRTSRSLIFDFAQSEVARLSGYLKDLGQAGDVTYEGEDRDWLLGLTKVTADSIDATSLTTVDAGGRGSVDGGLWTSDLGQLYLEAQREAIRRGVEIRRVFIMDRPIEMDGEFTGILDQHVAIGVQVRTLNPSDIMGTRRATLFDFIVFDGVLSYQSTTASRINEANRPIIVTTTLVTNEARVAERRERFADLWASGKPYLGPAGK
ncbi:DUF6879 family protein [Catellatospora tritici]|uniref:DUF6879 family protein n=1 Tax=Catellatospora tritici TaxID=2851566 RepID=UPI001C2D63E1|nr:DUF6879 family protein [Catellatospora tritici]MBV1850602.1 phosphatidylserine/phosphatidylglycerophosphate/cardiolipin synthase family protein [Catellatospora tritici]